MKKLAICFGIGLITMAILVSCAGKAFDSFSESVDTSNGFAGSSYVSTNK